MKKVKVCVLKLKIMIEKYVQYKDTKIRNMEIKAYKNSKLYIV